MHWMQSYMMLLSMRCINACTLQIEQCMSTQWLITSNMFWTWSALGSDLTPIPYKLCMWLCSLCWPWSYQTFCLFCLPSLWCARRHRSDTARKGGVPLSYQQTCLLCSLGLCLHLCQRTGCCLWQMQGTCLKVFQIVCQDWSIMALTLILVRSKLHTLHPLWLWSLVEISLEWK